MNQPHRQLPHKDADKLRCGFNCSKYDRQPPDTFHAPHLSRAFAAAVDRLTGNAETTGAWATALLTDAVQARASDVHLDAQPENVRVRFRIDGIVHDVASLPPKCANLDRIRTADVV